jgi:two-component system sensor histidine kinase TctE
MPNSLRAELLTWVLVPLMGALAIDATLTYSNAATTASVIQDRLLLGSARFIAQQISFEDGSFQHQIPPAALELFQADEPDHIYYRVTTGAGQLLAGYTELGVPAQRGTDTSPVFFEAVMRSQPVRVAAFYQPVVGNPSAWPVIVEVAQTMNAHQQLVKRLWRDAMAQQLWILALVTGFILFGLHRGLRPLVRLHNEVYQRREGTLERLQTQRIPSELRPLVNAFNEYMVRLENYTTSRSAFIQNAAHQLRTPLTVLATQISDASLAGDQHACDIALTQARKTLHQTVHLVNQFLALSSAEAYAATPARMSSHDFFQVAKGVVEDMAARAHIKAIDLGLEAIGAATEVVADALAVREMLVNLVDNAIRYTPSGGVVTVAVKAIPNGVALCVEDNGPGIAPEDRDRALLRFVRLAATTEPGSGLGLTIVKELAQQCGASLRLQDSQFAPSGLTAVVEFLRR